MWVKLEIPNSSPKTEKERGKDRRRKRIKRKNMNNKKNINMRNLKLHPYIPYIIDS